MGKISTSTRCVIDITGTDLLYLGELGGGLIPYGAVVGS